MKVKKHKRLTYKERVIIQTLLNENKTKAYIAKRLNRSRSTISREVNKLGNNPKVDYDAYLSHWCAKDDYLNKRDFLRGLLLHPIKATMSHKSNSFVFSGKTI